LSALVGLEEMREEVARLCSNKQSKSANIALSNVPTSRKRTVYFKKRTQIWRERGAASSPQSHGVVQAAGCQKRRRRVKRDRANRVAVRRQSRHTSRRRVAEEVAARESARAQPERVIVTGRAFAVEAKQPASKHGAQSPSGNQQQPVLRANSYPTSHRVQCIGFKGAPVATRENGLQLLHGGLKRVQERGARYQVEDELRISAPSLDDRALIAFALFVAHSDFLT
jgi:hypothetical protein